MKRSIAKDKLYKAIGKGERTSKKVSYITKADGSRFRRENANQYYNDVDGIKGDRSLIGNRDYSENRPNRTDLYPKDRRKKIMETGGKTPEEIAYDKEQEDAMFNSQYAKGTTIKGGEYSQYVKNIYSNQSEQSAREGLMNFASEQGFEISDVENALQVYKYDTEENAWGENYYTKVAIAKMVDMISGKYAKGSTVKGGGVENELYVAEYQKGQWTVKDKKNPNANYTLSSKKENAENVRQALIDSPSKLKYYRNNEYAKGSTVMGKYKKGGKTPMEAYEQEQHDAMYNSEYGKGGKTGCWCYEIGGL
jgi:hypothetical protein